jgi:hypothetical protein
MTLQEATIFRDGVVQNNLDLLREKFQAKRTFANSKLWPDGGSPLSEDLWPQSSPPKEEHIYGKELLRLLKTALKSEPKYRSFAGKLDATPSKALGAELSVFLAQIEQPARSPRSRHSTSRDRESARPNARSIV